MKQNREMLNKLHGQQEMKGSDAPSAGVSQLDLPNQPDQASVKNLFDSFNNRDKKY